MTVQGNPRLVNAPLIIPHAKDTCNVVILIVVLLVFTIDDDDDDDNGGAIFVAEDNDEDDIAFSFTDGVCIEVGVDGDNDDMLVLLMYLNHGKLFS